MLTQAQHGQHDRILLLRHHIYHLQLESAVGLKHPSTLACTPKLCHSWTTCTQVHSVHSAGIPDTQTVGC